MQGAVARTVTKELSLAGDENSQFFVRNLSAFLSRLAWRCHFVQKLEQQPSIEYQCMHPAFEGMRENNLVKFPLTIEKVHDSE